MSVNVIGIILIHIASLFTISGILKIISFKRFLQFVVDFKVLPTRLSIAWGCLLPFLELMGAYLLLNPRTWMYGAAILAFLLLSFLYAIIHALKSERNVRCGCYGSLIDATVDHFTLGKIMYFLLLLISISILSPLSEVKYSVFTIVTGIVLTLLTFAMQKVWQIHSETIHSLRKTK